MSVNGCSTCGANNDTNIQIHEPKQSASSIEDQISRIMATLEQNQKRLDEQDALIHSHEVQINLLTNTCATQEEKLDVTQMLVNEHQDRIDNLQERGKR